MGRCLRCMSSALISFSLARIRLAIVIRLTVKRPGPGLRAGVREPQEVERLWLAEASPRPVPGGEPPELDQPRLLGFHLQAELCEPLAQVSSEPLGVLTMLE